LPGGIAILIQGTLIAAVTAIGFWLVYQGQTASADRARTVAFCILVYAQLFFSFTCRSERYTLPELGLFTNPPLLVAILVSGLLQLGVVTVTLLQPIFEVNAQPGQAWLPLLLLALAPVTMIEVSKLIAAAFPSLRTRPENRNRSGNKS